MVMVRNTAANPNVPIGISTAEMDVGEGRKFLQSGTLSARKLTAAKVQNTTRFHTGCITCTQHGVMLRTGQWAVSITMACGRGARQQHIPANMGWVAKLAWPHLPFIKYQVAS